MIQTSTVWLTWGSPKFLWAGGRVLFPFVPVRKLNHKGIRGLCFWKVQLIKSSHSSYHPEVPLLKLWGKVGGEWSNYTSFTHPCEINSAPEQSLFHMFQSYLSFIFSFSLSLPLSLFPLYFQSWDSWNKVKEVSGNLETYQKKDVFHIDHMLY